MIISSFSRNISLTEELLCCDLSGNSLSSEKSHQNTFLSNYFALKGCVSYRRSKRQHSASPLRLTFNTIAVKPLITSLLWH